MSKRISKELADLHSSPVQNVQIGPEGDNLYKWVGSIQGPAESPYKGGTFKVSLTFSQDYPFKPPTFKFETKIYHPNVDEEGNICLSLLKTDVWKPSNKLVEVLSNIVSLLITPNPEDPLDTTIAELYRSNLPGFEKKAQEWVKKYAS